MQLFEKPADYEAFGQVMREALDESSMQICAYTAMPNHWHLLLWPECDGELATFVQRLTITHVRRWLALPGTSPRFSESRKTI
jgi:putative transposase